MIYTEYGELSSLYELRHQLEPLDAIAKLFLYTETVALSRSAFFNKPSLSGHVCTDRSRGLLCCILDIHFSAFVPLTFGSLANQANLNSFPAFGHRPVKVPLGGELHLDAQDPLAGRPFEIVCGCKS